MKEYKKVPHKAIAKAYILAEEITLLMLHPEMRTQKVMAEKLEEKGIPTLSGKGRWRPNAICKVKARIPDFKHHARRLCLHKLGNRLSVEEMKPIVREYFHQLYKQNVLDRNNESGEKAHI